MYMLIRDPNGAIRITDTFEHPYLNLPLNKPHPIVFHDGMSCHTTAPIPKTVHAAWLGTKDLSAECQRCLSSWNRLNPCFEKLLWADANSIEKLKALGLPGWEIRSITGLVDTLFNPLYEAGTNFGEKSDILRLFLLHRFGGIWTDCDIECLRPIASLIDERSAIIAAGSHPGVLQIENAFLAAAPAHPFITMALNSIPLNWTTKYKFDTIVRTGPLFLDNMCRIWTGDRFSLSHDDEPVTVNSLTILPTVAFYAKSMKAAIDGGAFGFHLWEGKWYV
jgi:mannosyltransferase OCH1-like enzyme